MTPALRFRLYLWIPAIVATVLSGIRPYDRLIWLAEVLPVLIALPILIATAKRFPLTPLSHGLMAFFSMILIIGGTYTYARVPIGYWLQEVFELSRNPWDRIGHFFQGVTPAILGRELLLRTSPLKQGKWLFLLVTLSCLGISALYELIEWGAAVFWGDGSTDFLGSQGDIWDAQWDMFLAMLGAMMAQIVLGPWQDKQLQEYSRRQS